MVSARVSGCAEMLGAGEAGHTWSHRCPRSSGQIIGGGFATAALSVILPRRKWAPSRVLAARPVRLRQSELTQC
jgi:hypothetical protein